MPLSGDSFSGTRKMVLLSVFISLSAALHVFESLLPNIFPVPGAKIGLANIVSLVALCLFGFKEGMTVSVMRVVIGSFLGGTFLGTSFVLSFCGAVASTAVMYALLRSAWGLSIAGVSIAGAACHNCAQVAAASVITGTPYLFYYLPFLLFVSVPTGIFTGMAAKSIVKKLENFYGGKAF